MNLNGTFTFAAPRDTVWTLLQDPDVLAKALPGTERLSLAGEDRFEGLMKVSVGPVSAATFEIVVQLVDKTAPAHFGMRIDGKGAVGFTKGTATVDLREQDGATVMDYASNVQVGGKIAAVGQRLLESVGRMMMKQALESLEREIRARLT
jgi:carbon monoxide dehydrogenase subunit G